jgi:hypothetical protein
MVTAVKWAWAKVVLSYLKRIKLKSVFLMLQVNQLTFYFFTLNGDFRYHPIADILNKINKEAYLDVNIVKALCICSAVKICVSIDCFSGVATLIFTPY